MTATTTMPLDELRAAQLENLRLLNEKVRGELNAPPRKSWSQVLLTYLPVLSALVALWGVAWGLYQYRNANANEQMKPWLQSQREIYRETLTIVAEIANAPTDEVRKIATDKFWQLYHGKMVLIETKDISDAMMRFSRCLWAETCDRDLMNTRTRTLASKMAASMAATAKMSYSEFETNQFQYR